MLTPGHISDTFENTDSWAQNTRILIQFIWIRVLEYAFLKLPRWGWWPAGYMKNDLKSQNCFRVPREAEGPEERQRGSGCLSHKSPKHGKRNHNSCLVPVSKVLWPKTLLRQKIYLETCNLENSRWTDNSPSSSWLLACSFSQFQGKCCLHHLPWHLWLLSPVPPHLPAITLFPSLISDWSFLCVYNQHFLLRKSTPPVFPARLS